MNIPKRASRHHFMRASCIGPNSRCHAKTTGSLVVEDWRDEADSAPNNGRPGKFPMQNVVKRIAARKALTPDPSPIRWERGKADGRFVIGRRLLGKYRALIRRKDGE